MKNSPRTFIGITNKSVILDRIKTHYNIKADSELASFLDVIPRTIWNWRDKNKIDYEIIYKKCKGISGNWLLSGKGEMFPLPSELEKENIYLKEKVKLLESRIKDKEEIINTKNKTISLMAEKVPKKVFEDQSYIAL